MEDLKLTWTEVISKNYKKATKVTPNKNGGICMAIIQEYHDKGSG